MFSYLKPNSADFHISYKRIELYYVTYYAFNVFPITHGNIGNNKLLKQSASSSSLQLKKLFSLTVQMISNREFLCPALTVAIQPGTIWSYSSSCECVFVGGGEQGGKKGGTFSMASLHYYTLFYIIIGIFDDK